MKGKKFLSALALVLFTTTLVQGCQKSPEEDIVVNKSEDGLDAAISQKAEDGMQMDAPERYEDSFETASGDARVSVSAKLDIDEGTYAVVRVKPHEITSEEAEKWGAVCFEGLVAYEEPGEKSKTQIEQEILNIKEILADPAGMEANYGAGNVEMVSNDFEKQIEELEEAYKTAPESVAAKEVDWTFHPLSYYMGEGGDTAGMEKSSALEAYAYGLNGGTAEISVTNRDADDYSLNMMWFFYCDLAENMSGFAPVELSEEEAIEVAEAMKTDLGLENYEMCDVYDMKPQSGSYYTISYAPVYEGTKSLIGLTIDNQADDLYASNLPYENLIFQVVNGKVYSIEWNSPMDTIAVENDNVKIMGFEEAYEALKNQMINGFSCASYYGEGVEMTNDVNVRISTIRLGMMRIKEKDNNDEYLMVPAWSMYGYVDSSMTEEPLVVLNALDGSVINVDLGY